MRRQVSANRFRELLPALKAGDAAARKECEEMFASICNEADNWDRIHPALQTFAQKMWRGGEGNPPWEEFAALADSLSEPADVKLTYKSKLR